VTLTVVVRY